MAQVLKAGAVDLSPYVRVAHEDGLDPANPEYAEPQFAGAPAFAEGQSFVGDAVSNRLMTFPLILKATSTDALYALVREINSELICGKIIEYRSGGASNSTFFDLETGRLEPQFQFWLDQAARVRATLHLWVRPRGHTGTTRLIASLPAGSAAALQFPATGVIGDEAALANLEVRVGSAVASAGRVIAYGVHPHPSFNGLHVATSGLAQTGATVRGASGAVGSQYTAIPVSPTMASGISYTAFLDPPSAHIGRHRVLALGRSGLNVPIALYGEDRYGAALGPTALATQTDVNRWQVLDLGEIQVPDRRSGQEPVPTQLINIRAGGASGAIINASPAFHLKRLIFLPLDYSAGILRTRGAGGVNSLAADSFGEGGEIKPGELLDGKAADLGGFWAKAEGIFYRSTGKIHPVGSTNGVLANGATGLYDLASGARYSDVRLTAAVIIQQLASQGASGASFEAWAKRDPAGASQGVWARLVAGPTQTLQLLVGDGSTATTIASVGIASTLASGIWKGQKHQLAVQVQGGNAAVWLATAITGSPILSASNAMISQSGNPAIGIRHGVPSKSTPIVTDISLISLAGGASDIAARETFRFESYPEKRVIQGNASVFKADRVEDHRGQLPRIAPMGSPAATGPAQIVVFQGEIDNVIGNDGPDVVLSVREQFQYLR
jgi:hypothetical protein